MTEMPPSPEPTDSSATPPSAPQRRVAVLGGLKRAGRHPLPAATTVLTLAGGADLDLTEAVFEAPRVTLTVTSLAGGVHLRVPADVEVVVEGFRLFGGRSVPPATGPTTRTVVVRSFGLVGGTRVERV